MMPNPKLERFLENWLTGGRDTREAFLFELRDLLTAERERCVAAVESAGLRMGGGCNPDCHKAMAEKINELH